MYFIVGAYFSYILTATFFLVTKISWAYARLKQSFSSHSTPIALISCLVTATNNRIALFNVADTIETIWAFGHFANRNHVPACADETEVTEEKQSAYGMFSWPGQKANLPAMQIPAELALAGVDEALATAISDLCNHLERDVRWSFCLIF